MCYRTKTAIVQGLQLKEKGILIFSSSCLCRCSEIGILNYGILSTQQLTDCRNRGGTRINPTCTEFTALKAELVKSTCLSVHIAAPIKAAVLKQRYPPHTCTHPPSPQPWDPAHGTGPGARAAQNHLAPGSPFWALCEILWAGFMAIHCPALQSTLSLNCDNHSYSPSNSLLTQTQPNCRNVETLFFLTYKFPWSTLLKLLPTEKATLAFFFCFFPSTIWL